MGNKQNKQKPLSHPGFKNCQKNDSKSVFLTPDNNQMTIDWINRLQNFQKYEQHKNLPLLLPQICETVAQNFCGTQNSYKLIYPYFQSSLHEQIKNRKQNNQKFTQIELWYLLFQLLLCSHCFQKRKMKSGDVRPANILLNQQGELKLVNQFSFPGQKTNYYKSLKDEQPTLLGITFSISSAPEELWQLQQRVVYPKSDQATGEAFSIGLTMIDAAVLEDSEELYDVKKIRFGNSIFNDKLVKFKTDKYSPFFVKTILNLIEGKTVDRLTPGEALAILRPYEAWILNLEQFIPDRLKSKQSLEAYHATRH